MIYIVLFILTCLIAINVCYEYKRAKRIKQSSTKLDSKIYRKENKSE